MTLVECWADILDVYRCISVVEFALIYFVNDLCEPQKCVIYLIFLTPFFNFHPLEVVSCYRDPQLQMAENTHICLI